jgi:hypothetical protein
MVRIALLAALLVSACKSASTVGGMRARAANDWDCPESSISVSNQGQNLYRVMGCGQTALYECSGGSEPPPGGPPQSDPVAGEEYRFQGAGEACHKVSSD